MGYMNNHFVSLLIDDSKLLHHKILYKTLDSAKFSGHISQIRLPRFQYLACPGKPTTTQQVAWHVRRSPPTTTYERHIILTLIGRTVEEVSVQEGIGYEAVMGIIRRHIQSEVDWDKLAKLEQVGVDEISLKKGHKDFVTIVSARIAGQIELLAVLKDRKKATVKTFLQSLPDRLKKRLNPYVATSMMALSMRRKKFLGSAQELSWTAFM
jgi:transposase